MRIKERIHPNFQTHLLLPSLVTLLLQYMTAPTLTCHTQLCFFHNSTNFHIIPQVSPQLACTNQITMGIIGPCPCKWMLLILHLFHIFTQWMLKKVLCKEHVIPDRTPGQPFICVIHIGSQTFKYLDSLMIQLMLLWTHRLQSLQQGLRLTILHRFQCLILHLYHLLPW